MQNDLAEDDEDEDTSSHNQGLFHKKPRNALAYCSVTEVAERFINTDFKACWCKEEFAQARIKVPGVKVRLWPML
jgi:hypothetical protein